MSFQHQQHFSPHPLDLNDMAIIYCKLCLKIARAGTQAYTNFVQMTFFPNIEDVSKLNIYFQNTSKSIICHIAMKHQRH